ncbi:MAG: PilW family protein [Rhodoferax sp.]|nr:PilW family protein [Rhodoferax sp.]
MPRLIPTARRRHAGFSLVELMVSMAIGLVLIAGLATLYANSSYSGTELSKSIQQVENGRYAADLLSEDLAMAGYYGDLSSSGLSYAGGAVCDTSTTAMGWDTATLKAPVAITGLSAAEAAALEATCLSNYKAGTEALVIRRLDPTPVTPGAASNGGVYLQTSNCASDPVATPFVLSLASTDFTLQNKDCSAPNVVRRFLTRVYYVARCDDCPNDSIPTLKRAELNGSAMTVVPIAEGIDNIGFEYGFDTDGDGAPDGFQSGLNPPAPLGTGSAATNDWNNVVGVRVHLLSRSTAATAGFTDSKTYDFGLANATAGVPLGPFNDAFKRRAYAVTARLNNVAGRREKP